MAGLLPFDRTDFAKAFAVLALVATCVRAIVPAGYMVVASADSRFITISLCSGHGPAEAVIDLTTGDTLAIDEVPPGTSPDKEQGDSARCVFASVAAFAEPGRLLAVLAPLAASTESLRYFFQLAPGRGLAAPPPASTGPPFQL
jgi:hypothetical protein